MITKLKRISKKFYTNPLMVGSLVMVVGSNLYNFSQLAFHFLAGRFLGKAPYGDLAAMISIIGIISIVQSALGMTIVKFIASDKDEHNTSNFIKWVYYWNIWMAIIVALVMFVASPFLAKFLNISDPWVVYFLGPILLLYILANTGRSVLQGLLKFYPYVLSLLAESVVKIPLAVLLMFVGFATTGAFGALFIGVAFSCLIVKFFLTPYLFGNRGKRPQIVPLLKYSSATFMQGVALTSMYSSDLILVKHFFPPDQAGIYASLAVLGRIVFFGASPITSVMFPMVAKKHSQGDSHWGIFYFSLLLVAGISAVVTALFYFYPQLVIGALYGSSFIEGGPLLWWFGAFMTLLAIAMLLTQYYLSLGKVKVVGLFIAAAILQILLIWIFHTDLLSVIQLSIISAALLAVGLFIYSLYPALKWRN